MTFSKGWMTGSRPGKPGNPVGNWGVAVGVGVGVGGSCALTVKQKLKVKAKAKRFRRFISYSYKTVVKMLLSVIGKAKSDSTKTRDDRFLNTCHPAQRLHKLIK